MRIFKPTFRRGGKQSTLSRWHVEFRDHNQTRRRVPAFTDKQVSEALGRQIETLVGVRVTRQQPGPELAKWMEGLPDDLRRKLADFGMIDERAATLSDPITVLVDAYHAALLAKGNTADHADLRRNRLLKVITGCRLKYWRDIRSGPLQQWLAAQRAEGMKERTSNHFVATLRGFCNWMVRDGRAAGSPLAGLSTVAVTDEKERGTLTVAQVRTLIEATATSPKRGSLTGLDRAMLYRLALETGLRKGAISSLTRSSFRFDDDPPTVTVLAGRQKNRRKHIIPLRSSLAAELRDYLALRAPTAAAFEIPQKAPGMLRADLFAAGLPTVDDEGRGIDFHALRHTTATWLDELGVDASVVQAILGHRTRALTTDRYQHTQRRRSPMQWTSSPISRGSGRPERLTRLHALCMRKQGVLESLQDRR